MVEGQLVPPRTPIKRIAIHYSGALKGVNPIAEMSRTRACLVNYEHARTNCGQSHLTDVSLPRPVGTRFRVRG